MSRLFNESRKASQRGITVQPTGNVLERVARLKETIEAERNAAPGVANGPLKQILTSLDESNKIASNIVATRLENCRRIVLPRDNGKSLLTSDYNLSMQQAVEAYQSLRTRLVQHQGRQGMRSLVVSSGSQGEGKTLTTFNLALCFARIQNWPVLLVDADLRTHGVSTLVGSPYSAGLGKVLSGGCSYELAVLRTDVPNLYVLPAGDVSTPAPELFSRPEWTEFIGWSSECFKLVLVDAPPILSLADYELIAAPCEGVMLVAREGKTSRESLAKICAHVDHKKLVGVVLNGTEEKTKNSYYYRYTTPAGGPKK